MFHIGWPQGVLLIMMILSLGISMEKHGQPNKDENAWITLAADVIVITLLYFGGFFTRCG